MVAVRTVSGRLPAVGGEVVGSNMRMIRTVIAAMAFIAVLANAAAPAAACSCPKEQLIKKYGTLSQVQRPAIPLPPPLPTTKSAAPAVDG
jgi:hypothetical protein